MRKQIPTSRQQSRLVAGAAYDRTLHALSMLAQIDTRDEASHGMPEDEIRQIAELLEQRPTNTVDIVHEHRIALIERDMAQVARIKYALAMPHVIMRTYHETVACKKTSELIVAIDMLFHAMHDLNDALEPVFRKIGYPEQNTQLRCSIT